METTKTKTKFIKVSPETHQEAKIMAAKLGYTFDETIRDALILLKREIDARKKIAGGEQPV